MEQIKMDPVAMGETKSLSSEIIKFKSLKGNLQNSIIPNLEKAIQARKNQEQKYLDNQDKLSEDRKRQLAIYTLETKERENDVASLHALLKSYDPICKVCDLVMHHTESMIRFEADKNETKALMAHFEQMINVLDEFYHNTEKINIFTDEGFKVDSGKLQKNAFKQYIDKLWNYLQTIHAGKNTK